MSKETTKLGLREGARVPQTIVLPLRVANETGVNRRFTLTGRNMTVPVMVRDWLMQDQRYAGLFSPEAADEARATALARHRKQAVVEVTEEEVEVEVDSDEESEEPVEETEETAEKADVPAWNPDWSNADLRAYAEKNGVELTSSDRNKAELRAKLTAAGLPESADATLDGEPQDEDEDEAAE